MYILFVILVILVIVVIIYFYMFYPKQSMPIGVPVAVTTIEPEKYHHDCLHPCIRYDSKSGLYYMAQSPYYGWNNKLENPMFYVSTNFNQWGYCCLISDTPENGYNSDPNICLCDNGDIQFIWRECGTPLCASVGANRVTVGGKIDKDRMLKDKQIYCINFENHEDTEQAPVMIEHQGERYIYATWYQYEPVRKNKGVAIWKEDVQNANRGGRMCKYQFVGAIAFESCITVDKALNVPLFGHIFYIPKPLYHDLWHFDLFEYEDKLYMVSVAEKGDNIMLSVAEDWKHFKTFRKPLVNNHYLENYTGYRQYFYKPTAFVKDDTLHVFYTANAKDDPNKNQLFHTAMPASRIFK